MFDNLHFFLAMDKRRCVLKVRLLFKEETVQTWTTRSPSVVNYFDMIIKRFDNWIVSWRTFVRHIIWYKAILIHQSKLVPKEELVSRFELFHFKVKNIDKFTQNKTNKQLENTCSVMLLWHKDFMHWKHVPCDEPLLDKAAVYCVQPASVPIKKPLVVNMSQTTHQEAKQINNLFQYNDTSMISSLRVCDTIADCTNKEDELLCSVYINNHALSDIINSTWMDTKENYQKIVGTRKEDKTLNFVFVIEESLSCFSEKIKCVYEINDKFHNRSLIYCKNGYHLESCEHWHCDNSFKCQGYYCVPWRYVCDGLWDCPFGFEETECNSFLKPGFYHCSYSTIFVLPQSICDKYVDCPMEDDEKLCDLHEVLCPDKCFCLKRFVFCKNVTARNIAEPMPHVMIEITGSSGFLRLDSFLMYFQEIVFANLSHNYFPEFVFSSTKYTFKVLLFLYMKNNGITAVRQNSLRSMPHLKYLNLAKNIINVVECHAFASLTNISILILHSNKLNQIKRCHFKSLQKLQLLDVRDNPFLSIDEHFFQGLSRNIYVKSSHGAFCCFGQNVVCSVK